MKNKESLIIDKLIKLAKESSVNSYSPYSNFPVGACVISGEGDLYHGSNVENASFGLTVCAERNAIFKAVNSGVTSIDVLVVYTPTSEPISPCGACRQVLSEFSNKDTKVVCVCDGDNQVTFLLDDLLPNSFKRADLK